MTVPKQCVIFCGGRGERLRPYTDSCPKPMVPVHGRPFLEYLIEQLRGQGVGEFLLLAGYLGEQIERHFEESPDVLTVVQPPEWETGKRLKDAAPLLRERFLLLYGDNYAPVSLKWLMEGHEAGGFALTVTFATKSTGEMKEIGYTVCERDRLLPRVTDGPFIDTINDLSRAAGMTMFHPGCFYHSVSDPQRLTMTAEYLRPKKVILLDRDGVINEKPGPAEYVTKREDFKWIEPNVEALRRLAWAGFDFIVLTNQPGIARGKVLKKQVDDLNCWMEQELEGWGVNVLDTYVCPHGWDDGCKCRKPMPGMFFSAGNDWDVRLDRTLYVGDDERDFVAASRAGCGFVYAHPGFDQFVLEQFKKWGIA